jgi:NAD(P)-dependent dehydrogenase (short-subunit alcohol dehydrogenase family)
MDARQEDQVAGLYDRVEREISSIQVVVFDVGGNVRFPIAETTSRIYRKSWEMCAYAGFLVVRVAIRMVPRGGGRSS